MIIKTSGNLILEVSKERAEAVKKALLSGAEYVEIDDILLKASSIMSVEKSPPSRYSFTNMQPLCLPTSSLTDEQRHKNVERIRDMKQKFLSSL